MYKCNHFGIYELVPPSIYNARGEKAWQLIDDRVLITLDKLRERYGAITVNNYHDNGPRQWSGIRTPDSPQFSPTSQHTFGRAMDCIFHTATVGAVRKDIIANPDDDTFKLINAIELGVSWLHFDMRNCDRLMQFTA